MRKRNGTLTPLKTIAVYMIALSLVTAHEFDRVVSWVETACIGWDSAPVVLEYCGDIRDWMSRTGWSGFMVAERDFFARAQGLPEIGQVGREGGREAGSEKEKAPPTPITVAVKAAAETQPFPASLKPGADLAQSALPLQAAAGLGELQPSREGPAPREKDEAPADPAPEKKDKEPASSPAAPAEQVPAAQPRVGEKKQQEKLKPRTILVAGDSMIMEGFGPALQRHFKNNPGVKVYRAGKYSTGLSRPDYFDWGPYLKELLEKYKPDMLVISLGANDPQDILDGNRKRHFVATESWNGIYRSRAEGLLAIARAHGVRTFWVGLPIMGLKKYGERIANINAVVREVCDRMPGCDFVDTWLALADKQKKYNTYLRTTKGKHIRIRAKDKIHLTNAGGEILVRHFLKAVEDKVDFTTVTASLAAPPTASTKASDARTGFYGPSGELKSPAVGVKVALKALYSQARAKQTYYHAFVPQTIDGPKKYPVLYLLHGAGDDYTAWNSRAGGKISALVKRFGLIVVTPDGDPYGWFADSPYDRANQIETFFMEELIPHVEKHLPALPGRRGIAGLSMGGHGAVVLALRHPGAFQAVSSMSGVLDITRHYGQWQLERVFGPYTPENIKQWRMHSAYWLSVEHKDGLKGLPILVTVASGDESVLPDNRSYHKMLEETGVDHDYREAPGRHDWDFWRSQLPEHAGFQAGCLNKN